MTTRVPEPSPLRRRRGAGAVTAVIVGLVLLLVGFLLGKTTNDSPVPVPAPQLSASPSPGDIGPRTVVDGVPLGYARSEAGAASAAVTFAEVVTGLADDPEAHIAAAEVIATPAWRSRSVELARNTIDFLRESYPGAEISFIPVRYAVIEYTQEAATVKVWGVTLVYPPNSQPEQTWATGTFELAWVGDWRMDGGASSGGPSPSLLKMTDELGWRVVDGFSDVDRASR